jgi:hypothetical protein
LPVLFTNGHNIWMKEKNVKVINTASGSVLYSTHLETIEKAFEFASDMEKMDIDVHIDAPSITDSLAETLGLTPEDKEVYCQTITGEIEDHIL